MTSLLREEVSVPNVGCLSNRRVEGEGEWRASARATARPIAPPPKTVTSKSVEALEVA